MKACFNNMGMLTLVKTLEEQMKTERSQDGFDLCWTEAQKFANLHQINIPTPITKRRSYISKQIDETPSTQHFHQSVR